MKKRKLIFKCIKEFEMDYILYDFRKNTYINDPYTKDTTEKEMLNLIIEEAEQHIPLTVKQQELIEKLNKKLVKYNEM